MTTNTRKDDMEKTEEKKCRHVWRETIIHTGSIQDGGGRWDNHHVVVDFCPDCGKIRNRRTQ
jgi:hypothetical protein